LMALLNQEFRRPIIGRFWMSSFFDAGNSWTGWNDLDLSVNGAAYGYGAGVQYISPAGPIRLDYARRIRTRRYASDDRWHFSILYAF